MAPLALDGHAVKPSGIITLLTDFGLADTYVGVMKGVILGINPSAAIVDLSHEVRPQQVEQGAFLLAAALAYFPAGTVHVAVVDPGVGTERRGLAVVTPTAVVVGPDNGLVAAAFPDGLRRNTGRHIPLAPGYRAFSLTNDAYLRRPASATFHGRDVFAPVAAHLSRGLEPGLVGEEVDAVTSVRPFCALPTADGGLQGRVVHIDRFGNLVTDVRAEQLPARPLVEVAGRTLRGVRRTYGETKGLLAVVGSSGYVEIAVREGNAAALLGADIGTPVMVRGG